MKLIDDSFLAKTNFVPLKEKELREALFYRDEFLSIASHELKTPLTSLKLHAQIFKRGVKRGDADAYSQEKVDRLISQIDNQINRLVGLVDDMLDISRIRTGKLKIDQEKVLLNEIILDLFDQQKPKFSHADQVTLSLEEVECFCDPIRIKQVLGNILNNALRYGNGGPIEIRLVPTENWVIISIKDSGIGIASSELDRIFEKFRRAVPANEVSGLGLGLFISKQIVEAHGGSIQVQSELNVGSIFSVILPLRTL